MYPTSAEANIGMLANEESADGTILISAKQTRMRHENDTWNDKEPKCSLKMSTAYGR